MRGSRPITSGDSFPEILPSSRRTCRAPPACKPRIISPALPRRMAPCFPCSSPTSRLPKFWACSRSPTIPASSTGSAASSPTTATLFTWHTSGTKTLADLKTRETLVAGTGPLSQAEINSTMLNGVVGTKFKLIRGYKGSGEAALAVERGEADGTLMPWEFLKSAHADWVRDGKISIVARYVRRPIPEWPEVRSVYDLAETTEQRNVLNLFLGADEMGHPIAMPPDVPRDRLDAVRRAIMIMVKDPEFLADAQKRKLDLLPGSFEELEKTVAAAFQASPAEIEIARKYYAQ